MGRKSSGGAGRSGRKNTSTAATNAAESLAGNRGRTRYRILRNLSPTDRAKVPAALRKNGLNTLADKVQRYINGEPVSLG